MYLYLNYHAEIYPALAHFCMTMRKGRRNKGGGGTGYGRGYRPQTPPAAEDKPTLGNFLRVGLPERIFDELLFRVEHHFRDGLFRTASMAVNTSSGRVKSVSRKQWMCIKRGENVIPSGARFIIQKSNELLNELFVSENASKMSHWCVLRSSCSACTKDGAWHIRDSGTGPLTL